MAKDYLLRLIASSDHSDSVDHLVSLIKMHGTDRYDAEKKQLFDDFYAEHDVDFFAEKVDESNLENVLTRMADEFPQKTLEDRARSVYPDIAIIYDASKCRMIEHVYDNLKTSDCYQFTTDPREALVEVRKL